MAGKTVKQLYGNGTGQSFMDRVNAAKYSVTGSGLAKIVCKATTEEMAAPKKKHLEYLVQCTNEPNVSIPELANLLIERTQQSNWVVVFKSLITIHHLMNYGNERFSQYLASNNSHLSLSNFTDRTGIQAIDMSKFVRQYSRYVEQKARSYRDMAFDFCKIKRGKENGVLRKMSAEKLMKTIPILEAQLDSMLDFDANGSEINHVIVYAAFVLLYKDAIRLFATYNDGMINLIEKYFSMNRKQCREALNCYKNFTKRMDRVNKFLRLAENYIKDIGCGDKDGLELQPVPPSVLEALENHLNYLEFKKGTDNNYSSTTNQESSVSQSEKLGGLTDIEKQKIIEEEKAKLEEFSASRAKNSKMTTAKSEPHLKAQTAVFNNTSPQTANVVKPVTKTSDDLVLLGLDPDPQSTLTNNYITPEVADIFGVTATINQSQNAFTNDPFALNSSFSTQPAPGLYKEINFDKAFGNIGSGNRDANMPTVTNIAYQPSVNVKPAETQPMTLDDKLASLVGSLNIGPGARSQSNNVTSVNWRNTPDKTTFTNNQVKSNNINWNVPNNSGSMSSQLPPMQPVSGGPYCSPIAGGMQYMPATYNQTTYANQMNPQFGPNVYNPNMSNPVIPFGPLPNSQNPFLCQNNNSNFMPFQTQYPSNYPNQTYPQFGSL